MIKIRNLTFEYFERDQEGYLTDMINAIRGINFDAKKGQFIGVVGKNGSGKSTFAKVLNRLLVPIEGTIVIGNMDACDEANERAIRTKVGMVFQNPDDQIIGSVVSEDVAFGAENIGVPQHMLWERVFDSIEKAGLAAGAVNVKNMADRRINELSGGEKQKVALAGVLAMKPECIVLDEATSMLDPEARWEIITLMKELREKLGITVIMITHMMEELVFCDNIYVMHQGKMVMKGRKEMIFSDPEKLRMYGIECPEIVKITNRLFDEKLIKDNNIFTVEGLVARFKHEYPYAFEKGIALPEKKDSYEKINPVNAILFNEVSFFYGKKKILDNVSFSVRKGEYVAVIGKTGSGKSTLLQLIPALLKCKKGNVYVDGLDVNDKTTDVSKLRCKTGYVFQYPEQQLFAKNVYEDVVFGPRNVGISEIEAEKRAYEAISLTGLSDEIYDMPISRLSGGEKRRVALAGVLAMNPEYLILDEPLAGLDPEGKKEMLNIINALHKDAGKTIIMVSHDMESVAKYAERVIVMDDGKVVCNDKPSGAFYDMWKKNEHNYQNLPVIMQLLIKLRLSGLPVDCMTADCDRGIQNIKQALSVHYKFV